MGNGEQMISSEAKSTNVILRVTPETRDRWAKKARSRRMTRSAWLRRLESENETLLKQIRDATETLTSIAEYRRTKRPEYDRMEMQLLAQACISTIRCSEREDDSGK